MHQPEDGPTAEESPPPQGGSGESGEIVVREDNAPSLGDQIGYPLVRPVEKPSLQIPAIFMRNGQHKRWFELEQPLLERYGQSSQSLRPYPR